MGYEDEEVVVEHKPGKGEEKPRPTVIRTTKKHVIPDVAAQIIWLKNHRPRLWKDKHVVGMDGTMNIKVVTAVPRSIKKTKIRPQRRPRPR